MKMIIRVVVALSFAFLSISAFPLKKRISIRGGSSEDVVSGLRNSGLELKRRSKSIRLEQIVPIAASLAAVAHGIDMLINPDRKNRFYDDKYILTETDKTSVAMLGAREFIKGIALAAMVFRNDEQSLRLANGLCLGSALIEETVDELTANSEGFRAVSSTYRSLNAAFRTFVSISAICALWMMRGSSTDKK